MQEFTIFWKSQIRHSELTHSYTRPRGKQPDYTAPVVLRNGKNTVRHFCDAIHKNIVPNFKNGEFRFLPFLLYRLLYHLYSSLPRLSQSLLHRSLTATSTTNLSGKLDLLRTPQNI